MFAFLIKFCAICVTHAGDIARIFDHGQLHAQANTQIGHFVIAREANRRNLPSRAALAKATRHQYRIEMRQAFRAGGFQRFGIDVFDINFGRGMDACMTQRFDQRFVDSVRSTYLPPCLW